MPLTLNVTATRAYVAGGGSHPNEPAGFTPVFESVFDFLPGTGHEILGDSVIDSGASNLAIITDATGPKGTNSLQTTYPIGLNGGDSPCHVDFWSESGAMSFTPKYNESYTELYLKVPTSTFYNNQVGTKLWYISHGNSFNLNNAFMLLGKYEAPSASMSEMTMDMHTAEEEDEDTGGFQGAAQPRYQNVGAPKKFTCGVWNHVEVYLNVGTTNNHDGIVRVWIDGTQVTEYTNIKFLDSDFSFTQGFFHGEWTPVWGGSGPAIPAGTTDNKIYLNYLYVSGK